MTQDPEHDEQLDEQLLARLRPADPAAGTAPLPQDALDALLRNVMSTPRAGTDDADTPTGGAADEGAPVKAAAPAAPPRGVQVTSLDEARGRRRRWAGAAGLGLAAAAAGTIVLTAGVPALTGGGPKVTALSASAPSSILGEACAPLDAASLSGQDLGFLGRVTEVRSLDGGEVVVLEVERVFRGDVGQLAEVTTPGAGSTVDGAVQLLLGQEYLVAAFDGTVSGCGATGPAVPELEELYEQAFGGSS